MKKYIEPMTKIFFILAVFLVASCKMALADVDTKALEEMINNKIIPEQVNQTNKPQLADKNNITENIDSLSGSLVLKQTDITLPGKDGMDLAIGRKYSSNQSEIGSKKYTMAESQEQVSGMQYLLSCVCYYPQMNQYITEDYASNNLNEILEKRQYMLSTDRCVDAYITYLYGQYYTTSEKVSFIGNYKENYDIYKYDLGAGWQFNFPSVQISNGEIQFHDELGGVYELHDDNYYGDDLYNPTGLKRCQRDCRFDILETMCNFNGEQAKYKFTDEERKQSYFTKDGELIGIQDVHGNIISFKYKKVTINNVPCSLIDTITDSIGRVVSFDYIEDSQNPNTEYIVLTIYDPNKTNSIKITYEKSISKKDFDVNGALTTTFNYPVLKSVTNAVGEKISYDYAYNEINYNFITNDLPSGNSIPIMLLTTVKYPNSASNYIYEPVNRTVGSGSIKEFRINSRYDNEYCYNEALKAWEAKGDLMHTSYSYTGDYTNTFTSCYTVIKSGDLTTTNDYDGKLRIRKTEIRDSKSETKIINNLGFSNVFIYKPTLISDENDLFTEIKYDSMGKVISTNKPLATDDFNNASTKAKYTTTYEYDGRFRTLTKKQWYQNETDSSPLTESYSYNDSGRLASSTNAKGEVTQHTYSNIDGGMKEEITTSLENGKTAKIVKTYGSESKGVFPTEVISYYTNEANQLVSTKKTMTYDMLLGLMKTETDDSGHRNTYQYDALGRVISIKKPDFTNNQGETFGVEDIFSYTNGKASGFREEDSENRNYSSMVVKSKETYTNRNTGSTTDYNDKSEIYDGYGNLKLSLQWNKEQNKNVAVSQTHYDNLKRPIYVRDGENNITQYAYDTWGRINEIIDPEGNLHATNIYDPRYMAEAYFVSAANLPSYRQNTTNSSNKENVIRVYFDIWGKPIKKSVFANGALDNAAAEESYKYDLVGNKTSYTDANGNINENGVTTKYSFDPLNRVVQVKDALNQVTSITYTTLGNTASVKMSGGGQTIDVSTKAYDEAGKLTTKTDPVGASDRYQYNSLGQPTVVTDRKSNINTFSYDEYSRATSNREVNSSNTQSQENKYLYNNPFGAAKVEDYINGGLNSSIAYSYDSMGRTTNISNNYENSSNYSGLTNEYNNVGQITRNNISLNQYGSLNTNYYYNKGKLTKVQTNGSQAQDASAQASASYDYYPDGKLKTVTYPTLADGSQLNSTYEYNCLNRLTALTNRKGASILSRYSYAYDKNGNILTVKDEVSGSTSTYVYDKLNRLTESHRPEGDEVYTYDLRGNRKTETKRGTMPTLEAVNYNYDVRDRLADVTNGTGATSFKYKADGLRYKKTSGTNTTWYEYNSAGKVIAESNSPTSVKATYVWGPDKLLAKNDKATGKTYYYLYNGHGDVVQIVDTNGNVVNNYNYDEWGNILSQKEGIENSFKYAGEILDKETGLYYLRARYYDASVGRFINEDTNEGDISNPLGLNLYNYCHNSPLAFIDPNGHAEYSIGSSTQPEQIFDEDFKYNPSIGFTAKDVASWLEWGCLLDGATFSGRMPEACNAYQNYRSNTGNTLYVDYNKAINEDSGIRKGVFDLITEAQNSVENLRANGGGDSFSITGTMYGIQNGATENWQKAIGAHYDWASADVAYKDGQYTMTMTIHMIDKYNFNKGMADIATGTRDEVNGRFAELGWAKSFFSVGQAVRVVTWTEGDINNSTNIVESNINGR